MVWRNPSQSTVWWWQGDGLGRNPSQSTVWWWQGDGLEESITVDCLVVAG